MKIRARHRFGPITKQSSKERYFESDEYVIIGTARCSVCREKWAARVFVCDSVWDDAAARIIDQEIEFSLRRSWCYPNPVVRRIARWFAGVAQWFRDQHRPLGDAEPDDDELIIEPDSRR